MIRPPCKDCLKRHIGCHAVCPDYLTFQRANEARKKKHYDELEKDNLIIKRYVILSEKRRKRGLK